jgi:uncharacterized iron-regulated membrane protein
VRPRSARRPLRAHVWLGTIAALPLLVVTGTGIVLGFFDPLRHAAPPHRLSAPVGRPLPPADLLARAAAAYPDHRVARLQLPGAPERAAVARMVGPAPRLVFLEPSTGAVLAERPAGGDLLEKVRALHHGALFGAVGRWVATASGLAAIVLWLLGDRVRARLPPRGPPPPGARMRRRMLFVHRRLGWVGGLALAALAATGGMLNHAGALRSRWLPEPRVAEAPGAAATYAAIPAGVAAYPRAALDRVDLPVSPHAPLRLRFVDGAWVYVDAAAGQVLAVHGPWHPLLALYPLHSGRFAGPAGPPAVAALGLVALVVVATGVFHHLRRRGRQEDARDVAGARTPGLGPRAREPVQSHSRSCTWKCACSASPCRCACRCARPLSTRSRSSARRPLTGPS